MTNSLLALASVGLIMLTSCASPTTVLPPVDRDGVVESINAKRDDYRACYENEINTTPNLGSGKINTAFIIENNGSTSHLSIASSTLNNKNVENCVLKVLETTKFKPVVGPVVTIKYPFSFTSSDRRTTIFARFSDQECHSVVKTNTSVISTKTNIDDVVRSFLVGPKKASNASLLRGPDPKLKNLYLGHRLDETTLVLRYKASAMELLNTTPCIQNVNITPLEQMLLEVKGVTEIRFEIGGKLVEGWDA